MTRPACRLLAYAAVHTRPVSRAGVAASLWPDLDETAAATRLRSTLWRMPALDGERLVQVDRGDGGRLTLADSVNVDVRLAGDEHRVAELSLDELDGEVLPDWSDEWVTVERERFRQLRLRLLEHLSACAQERREFNVALRAALVAVAGEPLRESAHRRVMEVHLAECNPGEALRQYDLCRRLLRDRLGIAPSTATRAVVQDLLGRPLDRRRVRRSA